MSLIEIISNPFAAKDLIAESLPDPIPLTKIITFSIPIFWVACDIASATLDAAKGVDFFAPLNPIDPALFQMAMRLVDGSATLGIVFDGRLQAGFGGDVVTRFPDG